MSDKTDTILSDFDIGNNLSDCSTDENLSDLSLDSSSENVDYEECENDRVAMTDEFEDHPFKSEIVVVERADIVHDIEHDEIKSIQGDSESIEFNSQMVISESGFTFDRSHNNSPTNDSLYDYDKSLASNITMIADEPQIQENLIYETIVPKPHSNSDTYPVSETDSTDYCNKVCTENDAFSNCETPILNSDYKPPLNSNTSNYDSHFSPENREPQGLTSDEKRFHNLQEEINLLNILMFEAENKTEKCGSLYHSFTNEINNNFAYSVDKASRVVDECSGSLASPVDETSSKCDASSECFEKNELIFSDYGKSMSNYDISESTTKCNDSKTSLFSNTETKSVSSVIEKMSIDSNKNECEWNSDSHSDTITNVNKQSENDYATCQMSVEDRVLVLWNQIIRLKCTLKNLQLNLKEQQMETLMQINEFLINQNINSNTFFKSIPRTTSLSNFIDSNNFQFDEPQSYTDSSMIFCENNKIKEDLALNKLKVALLECNMLSTTATTLVNSIPKFEDSVVLCSKGNSSCVSMCCCEQLVKSQLCTCPRKVIFNDNEIKYNRIQDKCSFKRHYLNSKLNYDYDLKDRKVKSHEEIGFQVHEAKFSHSEPSVNFDDSTPRNFFD